MTAFLDDLREPGRYRRTLAVPGSHGALNPSIGVELIVGTGPGPRVVLIAGVHGDEYEGVLALHQISKALIPKAIGGSVLIMPVANPISIATAERRLLVDHADLNRAFPGSSNGSLSDRIAAAIYGAVQGSDFLYSLHSWSKTGTVVPHIEVGTQEGAALTRSIDAARQMGFAYVQRTQWPAGMLVATTLAAGIPSVEAEAGGLGMATEAGVAFYASTITKLLQTLKVLPGAASRSIETRMVVPTDVRVDHAGLFVPMVQVGAEVEAGQPVGRVVDVFGDELELVKSAVCGVVGTARLTNSVHAGDRVFVVFVDA